MIDVERLRDACEGRADHELIGVPVSLVREIASTLSRAKAAAAMLDGQMKIFGVIGDLASMTMPTRPHPFADGESTSPGGRG